MPMALRSWLLDRGSLTQRLIDASGGAFRVDVLNQRMAYPRLSEARALGMPSRQKALVREVILFGCNKPWVYARSIIPITTLSGRLRSLRKLDNRPLGALLFNDRTMQRGDIEIACIEHGRPTNTDNLFSETTFAGITTGTVWGRRSVFFLDQKPLLVSEMFLPGFKPYNAPLPAHFANSLLPTARYA